MFLAQWGQAYDTESPRAPILQPLPAPAVDVGPWLLIFLVITITGALASLVYIGLGYYASLRASRKLFFAMLFRLCRAPIRFFDITPMGRVLNRFVSDFGTVDGELAFLPHGEWLLTDPIVCTGALNNSVRSALSGFLAFVSSFGVIGVLVPSFLPFAFIIAYLYARLAPAYILASRDLRRLELTSLSPTFAGFDELLAVSSESCSTSSILLINDCDRDFPMSEHFRWNRGIKNGFTRRWTSFKVLTMSMSVSF